MIEHYNAFISYRHAEKDIRIAERIQRDLEHFHVPHKLRKKTGIKKIQRIFRDKDELGTASDLSENIAYALEHSDFLIVICSTSTRESSWVTREISYFLQFHSRRDVLTVLVDGEPADVIPDILKYEDREFQNEYGQTYTVRFPLEPLSCDYRLPARRAKKEELPRLASALLRCSYDELMNRRRQYAIRRLTLIFSGILLLVAAFGVYMYMARLKIRDNYIASLRNQSIYLANEADQAYSQGNRILALQLALAALPKEEDDSRPVTAQAIRALTDSTLAYSTASGTNINAAWTYSCPASVEEFILSPNGRELAARDSGKHVLMWDTVTHELLLSLEPEKGSVNGFDFLSDGNLVVWGSKTIRSYDPSTRSLVWTYASEKGLLTNNKLQQLPDGTFLISTSENFILQISPEKGTLIRSYDLGGSSDPASSLTLSSFALSPNGEQIAFAAYTGFSMQQICGIHTISTGKTEIHEIDGKRVRDMLWADDHHIALAIPQTSEDSIGSYSISSVSYLETDHTIIHCMDTRTMTDLWTRDFTSTEVMLRHDFLALPAQEGLAYYCANRAEILRISDGKVLGEYNVNDSIVCAQDPDGDGWPVFITENGAIAYCVHSDAVQTSQDLAGKLRLARVMNGIYTMSNSSPEIIFYGLHVSDAEWTAVSNGPVLNYMTDLIMLDDQVLALITDEPVERFPADSAGTKSTLAVLTLINPSRAETITQIPLNDAEGNATSSYNYTLLGSYNNRFYLSMRNSDSRYLLISVDLSTGERTDRVLTDESFYGDKTRASLRDGKIFYWDKKQDGTLLMRVFDLSDGTDTVLSSEFYTDGFSPLLSPMYYPATGTVLFTGKVKNAQNTAGHCLFYTDGRPATLLPLPEDWGDTLYADYSTAVNRIAISDGNEILITDPDGNSPVMIRCPGVEPVGLCFAPVKKNEDPLLLVLYENGSLYRYSASTGEFVGMSNLKYYPGASAAFRYNLVGSHLYIQSGKVTEVFETETWERTTTIEHCYGYHVLSDRFFTYSSKSSKENTIGYFRRYSTEELIQKAKDILQNTEMSDELKSTYGITDETP